MTAEENKVFESKMQKTVEVVKGDFASVRAGRANAAVLDKIQVEYYGAMTPLQQVASISSPDPRTLMIQPWDASILKTIEKAIQVSDLGINPQNDGKVLRLAFPQLTEERRKELTKQVQKYGENGKVAIRRRKARSPKTTARTWNPTSKSSPTNTARRSTTLSAPRKRS